MLIAVVLVALSKVASTLVGLVGSPGQRGQDSLSPREMEVLKLVADGATNQVAARKLLVSETTIKTHLLHIYTKLGVRDRASGCAGLLRAGRGTYHGRMGSGGA